MNGPQSVFREADAEYDCPFVMGSEKKKKKKKKSVLQINILQNN